MTKLANTLSTQALAVLLTVVFSATMVLGAIGPAIDNGHSDAQVASGIANVPGKSANSLA